jgi:small ligand-binding sensory domain FIST
MGKFKAASCHLNGAYKSSEVLAAALKLKETLQTPARMAFAFVSPNYIPRLAEFCETLRVDGHIQDIIGCTTSGRIEGGNEFEGGSGFSVIACQGDFGDPLILEDADFPSSAGVNGWIALANPFAFPIEDWINSGNSHSPKVSVTGGLASGGDSSDVTAFINGIQVDAVAAPTLGRTAIVPAISQGCRPIGETFTVTRADQNVIYALSGQPAYNALERAFETLSDDEKSNARGNLFAGIAGSEYIQEFHTGDFLVKNIIGADPDSGAVVIAGIPRIGQTLQYHIRNPSVALKDLTRGYEPARLAKQRAYGALLFSCLGRGKNFFGASNQDASELSVALGGKPIAGFFCNGEIAPVLGLNAIHGYSAAAAVLVEKTRGACSVANP